MFSFILKERLIYIYPSICLYSNILQQYFPLGKEDGRVIVWDERKSLNFLKSHVYYMNILLCPRVFLIQLTRKSFGFVCLVKEKGPVYTPRILQHAQGFLSFTKQRLRYTYNNPGVLVCSGRHNKMPQTGWLKQQTLSSHSSGVQKCKIRVPAGLVSVEANLLGLQAAAFLLCPHMAFPLYT